MQTFQMHQVQKPLTLTQVQIPLTIKEAAIRSADQAQPINSLCRFCALWGSCDVSATYSLLLQDHLAETQ